MMAFDISELTSFETTEGCQLGHLDKPGQKTVDFDTVDIMVEKTSLPQLVWCFI